MTTNMNSTRARSPPSPPVSPPRRNPHATTRPMPPLPPNKNHRDRKPLPATHTHPQPKPKLACTKSYGSATSVISCASTSSTSTSTSISSTNLIMNSPVSPTKPLPHVRRLAISALAETQSMPVSVNRTHHFRQPPLTHAASQKLMKTKSHDVTLPPSPPQRKQVHATPIDAHYNPHKHLRKHFTENNILLHSVPSKSKNIPRTSPQSPKNPKSPKTLHTPRTPKSPQSPHGHHHHPHHHHRSASNSSNTSASHFSFQRRSSSESSLLVTKSAAAADPDGMRRDIDCICGRKMQYTQNPQRKYPPKALLYCQQNNRCRKQMMIGGDWFYSCKAKTSYHETKDGHFRICYSCSISQSAKQVRIRRNHQLLIKQMKNEHHGKVLITQNTKDYILSSTSSKSKDETLRLLKQTYIEDDVGDDVGGGDGDGDDDKRCETPSQQHNRRSLTMGANQDASKWVLLNGQQQRILKSGWMMKTGNFWNKSFKKRYFQLLHNKCLLYYKQFEHGQASEQRGMADLSIVHRITPKGNKGFEVCTPSRDWKFLCVSMLERDEWLSALRQFLNVSQAPLNVHHRKQYSDTMESHSQSCSHISQTHSAMNPMFATQCLHE